MWQRKERRDQPITVRREARKAMPKAAQKATQKCPAPCRITYVKVYEAVVLCQLANFGAKALSAKSNRGKSERRRPSRPESPRSWRSASRRQAVTERHLQGVKHNAQHGAGDLIIGDVTLQISDRDARWGGAKGQNRTADTATVSRRVTGASFPRKPCQAMYVYSGADPRRLV